MNLHSVVVFLSICLLVPSVVGPHVPVKRHLVQFGAMIDCATGIWNGWYWDYGCFCGPGGTGNTPVDELDRCCQVHDKCYGDSRKACTRRRSWRMGHLPWIQEVMRNKQVIQNVKIESYYYNCDAATKIVTCGSGNSECAAWACDCDSQAAMCFARATYQSWFWNHDQALCK